MINEKIKDLIIESAIEVTMSDEDKERMTEKRNYFHAEFSQDKIANLDKEHFFQGRGIQKDNFTYELEWGSMFLGKIGGGSVYKFGYEEDFKEIKELLIKVISAKKSQDQFYDKEGELSKFSKEIIDDAKKLRGVARVFIGKVLSIYFSDIFINIFGHQDRFLRKIFLDYKPEYNGVELYLRNNYLLLDFKEKYLPQLSNDEFSFLLYQIPELNGEIDCEVNCTEDGGDKIDALEVQHYQSLIHRNFKQLFNGKLRYYEENQCEKHGHFDTQEVGVMDFLAIDRNNDFVVIELKRNSNDQTLGQVLRYMGWVKSNLCKKNQKVRGEIIAESRDNRLEYALTIVSDVIFRRMDLIVKIEELKK